MAQSFTTAEYLALPRPESVFIIDDLLPFGGSLLLYGSPKVGKSFLGLQMAQAIAHGEPWFSFPTKQSKVMFIQLDTPRSLWIHRIENLVETGEALDSPNIIHADRESLGTWPFNILQPEHWALLREQVDTYRPDVVILDCLKELHQTPENDNTEGQRVMAALTSATQPAALVLIHHSKKEGDRPHDIIQGARGASYLTGRMDAIIYCTPKTFSFVSRATEGGTLQMERKDNGYWEAGVEGAQFTQWVEQLLADTSMSLRQKARHLSEMSGRSPEACRSILRRAGMGL
jgi:RecA-family ATPase